MSQPITIWHTVKVRWDFLTKLCSSVPADPAMRAAWLEARQPSVRPPSSRSISEINEEVVSTIAEEAEEGEELGGLLVFQRVNGACVMRAATIKAHLKDCARVLSNQYIGKIKGERSFATRILNGVYPDPATYWIPVLRQDGLLVREPDGRFDKAVHVKTMQGSRSAIKTMEYIEQGRMEFSLKILLASGNKPSVSVEDLTMLLTYGGVHGYAGERGDGEGRYTFTIESVDGKETR